MERYYSHPQPAEREQVEMPGPRSPPEPSPPAGLRHWPNPLVNQWTRESLAAIHAGRPPGAQSRQEKGRV